MISRAFTQADMPLFRGMFLTATLSEPLPLSPSSSNASSHSKSDSKSNMKGSKSSKKAKGSSGTSTAHASSPAITFLGFQQTFLPKFENERQDESIADAIVAAADERYMVATVKHSGSLNTLSHTLMGAKNSTDNQFTGVGILLLHAHYARLFPCALAATALSWSTQSCFRTASSSCIEA